MEIHVKRKYLFATEYVEDGSDMYDILKSHIIKGDFDDEAFNSGEEVVIFVDKNLMESMTTLLLRELI